MTRDPPIEITLRATAGKPHAAYVRRQLRRVVRQNPGPQVLSVVLVGDATMSRLHRQFLGIDGPTDVLTFELGRDARGRVTEGEIICCVPEARRSARRVGTSVERELLLYAVHGLLHLTGHDDLDDAGYGRMHRAEDRILTRLGVGPVFRPRPPTLATEG